MSEFVKTITSSDGRNRAHITKRADGLYQFTEEHLHDDEDQGQRYSIWQPKYPSSGLFPDQKSAEEEIRRSVSWIIS